ncbi:hypothetical protein Aspvir_003244 [Aspergillus viridinutans]|uniref:Uncharacterized protein n=1 Tax=Aspergillus viridinutans TaxID=75553 RepID=A0A9P3C7G8_ASPVI|nr:uncharacterized protein Aspvir_003244 [Aspergillus viridinutans]GIK07578.1 hypothetical protein Aspvir_003244 [Aspergillus viridinutans]
MAPRTIYLISYRQAPSQRAHFAIFVPSATDPEKGSVIHAVGAPMAGYSHEFKRGYNPTLTRRRYEMWPIGEVDSSHIVDWPDDIRAIHTDPKGDIEIAASQVPAPGISENFMAPVNDTTNRRCQEWTMEYVRHLVAKGYIGTQAVEIVQSKRDPPTHGIGLRPVAACPGHSG